MENEHQVKSNNCYITPCSSSTSKADAAGQKEKAHSMCTFLLQYRNSSLSGNFAVDFCYLYSFGFSLLCMIGTPSSLHVILSSHNASTTSTYKRCSYNKVKNINTRQIEQSYEKLCICKAAWYFKFEVRSLLHPVRRTHEN